MPYPPRSTRRRKLRRPAFAIVGIAVVLGAAGFVYWHDTRFPARAERLAGTPVVLHVQRGVEPRELRAIRTGIRLEDRLLTRGLGRPVRRPVRGRVARHDGCQPLQAAGGSEVGEARSGFLCVDTRSPGWQWLVLKDLKAATAVAAHEYVHVWQGEVGCLPPPRGQAYRWLVEGMASDLGWRALRVAGRASAARISREIAGAGAFDTNLQPLQRYERQGGRDPEYALWQMAATYLLRQARSREATPAARPALAFRRFCARAGAGVPWRVAFRRSFGISTRSFYAHFERARQREMLTRDPTLGGR